MEKVKRRAGIAVLLLHSSKNELGDHPNIRMVSLCNHSAIMGFQSKLKNDTETGVRCAVDETEIYTVHESK